jgi:hypothetical protein
MEGISVRARGTKDSAMGDADRFMSVASVLNGRFSSFLGHGVCRR